MARRRRGRPVHGVVLLDKQAGMGSNTALQRVRRVFNAEKAGHTGTLDPFATGMLPICLGEATKTAAFLLDSDKTYTARAVLGQATDTGDTEGHITKTLPVPELDRNTIESALAGFVGQTEQVPPMYSAIRHGGRKLYDLARAGIKVDRKARTVLIHELRLVEWNSPYLIFDVHCGKGTYIRTLAEDLARKLGCCAHLDALRRRTVAHFEARNMVSLDTLREAAASGSLETFLLPADAALAHWPVTTLESQAASRFRNGNPVDVSSAASGMYRVVDANGSLLGLGEISPAGKLSPRRVFNIVPRTQ
ncbi:MAG: tRNA pseudouridine(55) synthase TruB [Xanthomonadales bacterium]|nr:tRNA pseudouridine(55) synthase TruB [Xanthomonadales bacterium]